MPHVPAVPGTPGLKAVVRPQADAERRDASLAGSAGRVFSDRGGLAAALEGYEPREGQRRMAEAVAAAIEDGGLCLAEAGTGTGKTLAYLVPAILSGRRVLVSTGTKNLQEQIFLKDLPLLQDALGSPFTATLMKGRANYLCLHRWELYREGTEEGSAARTAADGIFAPIIEAWLRTTDTGDRAELRDLPEDVAIWKTVAADAESCLGSDCPHFDECFVTRMRRRAAESDVVIVNHHLLCADAAVRQSAYGEVIPACSTLVVDEAHQLEDVATQYFGCSVSPFRIDELVRDGGKLMPHTEPRTAVELERALARVSDAARLFFSGLLLDPSLRIAQRTDTRVRYTAERLAEHVDSGITVAAALDDLERTLALAAPPQGARPAGADEEPDEREALAAIGRRSVELSRDLRFLLRAEDADFVYFIETRGRGVYLRAAPIDVSRIIREALFDRMRSIVLTSATLAVDDSFEYVKRRLGIGQAAEVRVPSEFDYAHQALLYLPRRMPSPKSPSFAEAAAREIVELLLRSRGRAFVLFTSYGMLRAVQPLVEMSLPYPILVQGSAPRTDIIERFRTTPHAVLLATSSFWQGVDVAGEALSCVVIDRLPFAAPGDPVMAARIEAIGALGGDAFADYQVPLAILALLQGLGRLIRHRKDRGVLAVLDPRLRTMGYGRRFLASLPPAPVTDDLDAVTRFFV